jgi:hypothetical protein
VHRVAYEVFRDRSEIVGKQIHHTCMNKWCVNPWHMVAVTPKEHVEAQGAWGRPRLYSPEVCGHTLVSAREFIGGFLRTNTARPYAATERNTVRSGWPRKPATGTASGSRISSLPSATLNGILKPPGGLRYPRGRGGSEGIYFGKSPERSRENRGWGTRELNFPGGKGGRTGLINGKGEATHPNGT